MSGWQDQQIRTGSSVTYTHSSETTQAGQRSFERVLNHPSMWPKALSRIHSRLLSSDWTSEETLVLLSRRWMLAAAYSSWKKSLQRTLDYRDILNRTLDPFS